MTSLTGEVRIVGAGLLGTSIGLALTKQGIDVAISSKSTKSVDLAVSYGAGRAGRHAGDARAGPEPAHVGQFFCQQPA